MDPSSNGPGPGPATLKIRLSAVQAHGGVATVATVPVGNPILGTGGARSGEVATNAPATASAGDNPTSTTIRLTVPTTTPVFPYTYEEQFIIRMPPALANQLREELREGEQPEDLSITFIDARRATVLFHGRRYVGALLDLPTILETHKTRDRTQYYKIADISQMLMVLPEGAPETGECLAQWEATGWQLADGITPPMRAVRKRRFRRATGEMAGRERDVEALEKRVQALLDRDSQAATSSFTVYDGAGRAILMGGGSDGKLVRLPAGGPTEGQTEGGQPEEHEEVADELEHESDEEFAAELEEEMLLEEQATEAGDETSQQLSPRSPATTLNAPSPSPSPAVIELQAKINERKAQLASVSNPLIKARLEDVIRQLEQDLQARIK